MHSSLCFLLSIVQQCLFQAQSSLNTEDASSWVAKIIFAFDRYKFKSDMALASIPRVVLGSIAFAIFWVLAVFPAVPFLPVGRTAGSLLGAMLMVVFRVLTPEVAYSAVDLNILGLLFGTMVVSVYLERADMFRYLGKLLSWKSRGAKDMMLRICLISALSSALFTNDTSCVVLTEFVLKITRQHNLPPHPFLLALASSANIGSSATPIGNPQNLVIAVQSGISFGEFLIGLLPAMVAGVFVNAAILLGMYWKVLSVHKDVEEEDGGGSEVFEEDSVISHRFSPATMSHVSSLRSSEWIHEDDLSYSQRINNSGGQLLQETLRNGIISSAVDNSSIRDRTHSSPSPSPSPSLEIKDDSHAATAGGSLSLADNVIHVEVEVETAAERKKILSEKRKRLVWKLCVYLVTVGMLVALLVGLNMSWTAITAALALVVLDFKDARPSLDKVSYSLLIFFCGMFITVEGFNKTGIPDKLWEIMEPYSEVNHGGGVAVLAVVILILSNVASNVPTVLLLGGRVAASAAMVSASDEKKAWLVLAWVSTVAGNLSLLGSAANLIVCEQARRAPIFSYNLTFWSHLKFGVPSTLVVTAIGLLLLK